MKTFFKNHEWKLHIFLFESTKIWNWKWNWNILKLFYWIYSPLIDIPVFLKCFDDVILISIIRIKSFIKGCWAILFPHRILSFWNKMAFETNGCQTCYGDRCLWSTLTHNFHHFKHMWGFFLAVCCTSQAEHDNRTSCGSLFKKIGTCRYCS